jgi:hypothetical protein
VEIEQNLEVNIRKDHNILSLKAWIMGKCYRNERAGRGGKISESVLTVVLSSGQAERLITFQNLSQQIWTYSSTHFLKI